MILADDGRLPPFCWVARDTMPAIIAGAGPIGLAVYMVLASYTGRGGECWPSVATLARDAGVSERKARQTLRALEVAGVLSTGARRANGAPSTNVYTLHDHARVGHEVPGGGASCAAELELMNKNQGTRKEHHQTPSAPPVNPQGQTAAPDTGSSSAVKARAARQGRPAPDAAPRASRWQPVAVAILAAMGRPAPRGAKLPAWLGNTVAAFGAAAGDDPARALSLVQAWQRGRVFQDALRGGFVRDHALPAMAGAWLVTDGRRAGAAAQAAGDGLGARLAKMGAPDNWRAIIYAHNGVKRAPALALPLIGLEPYAPADTWPAWFRAAQGVAS